MLFKLLAVLVGTGPIGIADMPRNAVPPNADQFYESCWSALAKSHAEATAPADQTGTAWRMHAICDAVYAETTGHTAPAAVGGHFSQEMATALAQLPASEHTTYLVAECKKVAGDRQDICSKIEYRLTTRRR